MATALPEFVIKYLELLEYRNKMKTSYHQQDEKVQQAADQLKPEVMNWLKLQQRQELDLRFISADEQPRFGKGGKLSFKIREEPKPLSYSRLDQVNRMFFCKVLQQYLPNVNISADTLVNLASVCTDYCWVNREKQIKEDIQRSYSDRKRLKRKKVTLTDVINNA